MISETAIQHLIDKLGPENVLHEKEDLLVFGYDSTPGSSICRIWSSTRPKRAGAER